MAHFQKNWLVIMVAVLFWALAAGLKPAWALPSGVVEIPQSGADLPLLQAVLPSGYSLKGYVPALRAQSVPPAYPVRVYLHVLQDNDVMLLVPGIYAGDALTVVMTRTADAVSSEITLAALDGTGGVNAAGTGDDSSQAGTFFTTAKPASAKPVLTGSPLLNAPTTKLYSFTPVATDQEKDPLTFSIVNKPSWATFNTQTGALTGTPTTAHVGTYAGIVISVTDGTSTVSLPAFTLNVAVAVQPELAKVTDGLFKSSQTIPLTCTTCVAIYYTLDGTTPTTKSLLYKDPIAISAQGTTQLRYFGVDASGNQTAITTNTFTIDTIAPQVTVTDPPDGAYVNGVNSIKGTASDGAGSGIASIKLQMTDGTDYVDNRTGIGLGWYPATLYTSDTLPWLAISDLSKNSDFSSWMFLPPNLKTGSTYTLTVRATDKAGNATTLTSRFTNTDKIVISGAILDGSGKPLPDVTITFADNNKGTSTVASDTVGQYQWIVPISGWSGKITPTKQGYTFSPAELVIPSISAPRPSTHFTATLVESEQDARVIIMAGGDLEDYLWSATKNVANFAYTVMRKKGIAKQNIRYFSMDINQDLDNEKGSDIDGLASSAALEDAITNWAGGYVNSKKPLIIYMVDHGLGGQFLATKPQHGQADIVTSAKLEKWLNALQTKTGAKVILIMDACYSGSFVHDLIPPKGISRIVITSTDTKELAYFASDGDQSFSSVFWKYILMGKNLRDSFVASVQMTRAVTRGQQHPIMDADSDGAYSGNKDSTLVSTTYLGTPFFTAAVFPEITDSIPDSYMEEKGAGLTLWVQLQQDASTIDRVWGVIVPPGTNNDSQDPITNLPILALKFNTATKRYEATFDSTVSGFKGTGQYVISFYAQANDGEKWTSLPKSVTIQVGQDEFEADNTAAQASIIVLNDTTPQHHNTHVANDADWVKFYGIKDVAYAIEAINLGKSADLVLELFDADGVPIMKAVNDNAFGVAEKITFTAAKNGVYFVKVSQFAGNLFGADTEYDLKIYRPYGPIVIPLVAYLINTDKTPMANAVIQTSGNETAITDSKGRFTLMTDTSNTTLDLTINGVQSAATGVQVILSGKTLSITPSFTPTITPPLDVDKSGTVDATDGVLILRKLNGASTIDTGVVLPTGQTNSSIMTTLNALGMKLDVDQSSSVDATDGVLILRKLNGASTIDTGVVLPSGQTNRTVVETIDAISK